MTSDRCGRRCHECVTMECETACTWPECLSPAEQKVLAREVIADILGPEEDNCPECGSPVREKSLQEGGGVVCSAACGWWFCY